MRRRRNRRLAVVAVAVLAASAAAVLGRASSGVSASSAVVDRHAYPRTLAFYKCTQPDDLARRDMVVGQAPCDVARLRERNRTGIFLLQPGLFPSGKSTGGQVDYGGMHVTYGSGLWHWRKEGCDKLPGGVNLGCIRAFDFDYDYLHDADGSYSSISASGQGHRGWNIADPLNRGTRDLVAKFTAYTAKVSGIYSRGWDGIFSDNWIYGVLGEPWAYGPSLDANVDRKVDDLGALRRAWDDGLNDVGTRLRSYLPGKVVVGNGNWYAMKYDYRGSDPQGWLKAANGTMIEGIDRWYNSSTELLTISSRWMGFRGGEAQPRYLLYLQNALDANGKRLRVDPSAEENDPKYMLDPAVMQSMRWGLTLALMTGAYYELHLDARHGTRWWYDEYDGGRGVRQRGYLGQPTTKPIRVQPGVWRRDFKRGLALNNSTTKPVTIRLKKPYRHLRGPQNPRLNDGKVVSNVTLGAHDGVILVSVKRKPKSGK